MLVTNGSCRLLADRRWVLNWLGSRYSLTQDEPFSESELKLLTSIGAVLDARYRMIIDATRVEQRFELFRGVPEDRHVSAFVDGAPYAQRVWEGPDRVEDAIEVLRTSSLSTYENRRISTGVLLFGKDPDPCHEVPVTPAGALRYSPALAILRHPDLADLHPENIEGGRTTAGVSASRFGSVLFGTCRRFRGRPSVYRLAEFL